ncbi:MAG: tRNA (adenosine(37)-N6)-threonylcarbamoyltransferase complex ATPase subunit type 1 TsaE [Opitutales bacterium]
MSEPEPSCTWEHLRAGWSAVDAAATRMAGRVLAESLPGDTVVALSGPMGAGKTTFVQGMAAAWSIPGPVTSPTYTLYQIHAGDRQLVHVDACRLDSPDAWDSLMIEPFLQTPWCLAIEWPENLDTLPDGLAYQVSFSGASHPEGRSIQVKALANDQD